jgi:hypothetical protein
MIILVSEKSAGVEASRAAVRITRPIRAVDLFAPAAIILPTQPIYLPDDRHSCVGGLRTTLLETIAAC